MEGVFMGGLSSKSDATTIHIRVDREVKEEVEELVNSMGLSIASAVNMFFRQTIAEQAIPFQPKVARKILPKPMMSLSERFQGFDGEIEYEELDSGPDVGREVIHDIFS